MPAITPPETSANPWLRIAALALVVAGLGLPINEPHLYALLLIAAVAIFAGALLRRPGRWLAALAVVVLAIVGQWLWPAPRIDEGHNVFVVEAPGGALERGLPADAFRLMRAEFDARYPAARRCEPRTAGCWRAGGVPDRAYAFSADGIHDRAAYSRRVTDVDFTDPVRLRLGFINELQYNWYGTSDVERGKRERRWWLLLHPWQLTMPYFVMLRFPADFVGGRLCWQGNVLWEGADRRFTPWRHPERACRPIERADVGRMIFGLSTAAPLEMSVDPPLKVQFRRMAEPTFALVAVAAVLLLLVRIERRTVALPFTLIALALIIVLLNDASFVGGVRPFDGGDDGLFYEGTGRRIVQHLLRGDYALALEGGEKVYYYGGPGLRYLRALERLLFGDSFYGYLSLVLLLPVLVFAAFRRFFTARAALALVLIFIAIPLGALFGTTFFHYVKWAARGFADPAAAILFLAGLLVLIGRTPDQPPDQRFQPALGAGLLFALALWVRPNLAPGAAVLLGGAGLAALWRLEIRRLAGLCFGFLPVFGMAWHNWHFGGEFVLFSSNATLPAAMPMPPRAYVAAFGELLAFDFDGPNLARGATQWLRWLSGPSESALMAPLHAVAVLILLRVGCGRNYDPWLRLIAFAALALHAVAWFYLTFDRYHYLAWLLTLLVCAVFVSQEALDWPWRAFPRVMQWLEHHPARAFFARALDRWAAFTGVGRG